MMHGQKNIKFQKLVRASSQNQIKFVSLTAGGWKMLGLTL